MSFSLFPEGDRALATRLKRQLMGLLSYLMFLAPLAYSVQEGWLRIGYPGLSVLLVAALAINACFFVVIRSGISRRYADPSLMPLQIGIACLFALVIGYYVVAQAMVVVLMLFFTSFFFGTFSFSTRQYLAMTAAAALAYAIMLLFKYDATQRDSVTFHLELLHFIILVVVLLWMSLLGGYIAGLRASLAKKKDALAAALGRLKELASRDELTGLHNRRHLMEVLEQQQERSRRYSEPFALCILDLDRFKYINDTHGHNVGDEVLCEFSERIRSQLRRMDVIGRAEVESTFGRYGGEEFLMLLPYAAGPGACSCVERLLAAIHQNPFATSAGPLTITFSAGVAQYRKDETIVALINRADEALYRAKTAGRDRVECAD
ncbi:MAG TPA: GGDEF domain-containing protein [Xanthomonadaceae bacterium]|jgi:diguanylate cyclase (GGDEF)-like protein|nr:GGDEF domain-containing protein [Xanthomonadaceae bacterium]